MTYINITIKGIDERKYRKVKSIAAEENAKVGELINEALEKLIEAKRTKEKPIDKNDPLFNLDKFSIDYGVDTDVKNADKYIYQ